MDVHNWKKDLGFYLTKRINDALLPIDPFLPLEEIRLRAERPIQLVFSEYERMISGAGERMPVTQEDISSVVSRICEQSVYAWESELSSGFVTLPGGYRVGVTGKCVMENGGARRISDITSVNIRITRQCAGVAAPYLPALLDASGRPLSTLVVSPPGCGKTTFLRDLARLLSCGCGVRPQRVSIVDTRYELAGCVRGVPRFDVGPRTDVRSGGEKADGILSMLLVMSPQVIVTDEIAAPEDVLAVLDACGCGVAVLSSTHGANLRDLISRPVLGTLIGTRVFSRYVLLSGRHGAGTVEAVYGREGEELKIKEHTWQRRLHS